MGYDKQFLIDAFLWRYTEVLLKKSKDELDKYVEMITDFYDSVGKEKFRVYASLDAAAIKKFCIDRSC
jgi:hypothetical protein